MNICVLLPPKRLCKYSGMVFTCRKMGWKMMKKKKKKTFLIAFWGICVWLFHPRGDINRQEEPSQQQHHQHTLLIEI